MTVAERLAMSLKEHGVRRFFGIPGGPSIPYMEAFRKEGIEFVLTSHEASAAVMADVTARITGITGVCHGTFGPGATNLSTGVGGALLDRSPLLALTSEVPDSWIGRTTQMNIDHQSLYSPLTKATFRLTESSAGEIINESLGIANAEFPGPVHIGLPSDIADRESVEAKAKAKAKVKVEGEVFHLDERVRVLLASAKRPVIGVGLTAMRAGVGPALLSFLDSCPVPLIVTPMAKGIIPESHPCYAGVIFHSLSDRIRILTREADLIIGLGYDPVEYNYESWVHSIPLIHFSTIMTDLQFPGSIQVACSPSAWFDALKALHGSPEMMTLAREVRSHIKTDLHNLSQGFSPVKAIEILHELLPRDSVVTADVGSHLHLLGQMWDIEEHGKLIMTNGWSSMGFGVPAAIAAALASPKSTVACVTGDGGLMMYAGEMMTARRLGVKLIVVVMADGELNLIRVKESWRNLAPYGTELYTGPLFSSESFLGTRVMRVTDSDGMRSAIRTALHSDKSVIIEAAINPEHYGSLIVRS